MRLWTYLTPLGAVRDGVSDKYTSSTLTYSFVGLIISIF